jgi:uncharacterized protein (TIGR02594 family)
MSPASARPSHHQYRHTARHHHHHPHVAHTVRQRTQKAVDDTAAWNDDRYAVMRADWTRSHAARGRVVRRHGRRTAPRTAYASAGFTINALVADARRYLGTNPTGRRSLWCGAFMDKILRDTGHRGGGNLALGYAHYGRRISGPRIGAIAVMRRRGGGHVGVVSGIDANGNPIIISGNHNHTVAEAVYPRRRIVAYVMPVK